MFVRITEYGAKNASEYDPEFRKKTHFFRIEYIDRTCCIALLYMFTICFVIFVLIYVEIHCIGWYFIFKAYNNDCNRLSISNIYI